MLAKVHNVSTRKHKKYFYKNAKSADFTDKDYKQYQLIPPKARRLTYAANRHTLNFSTFNILKDLNIISIAFFCNSTFVSRLKTQHLRP